MADDFKILVGTAPPVGAVGDLLQGIGFPLRVLEPSTSGGPVNVKTEESLRTESFLDQDPVGLGVAMQIVFGAPDSTPTWSVDAAGAMTCLVADEYSVQVKVALGREGGGGIAQIYLRGLIDGVAQGNTSHTIVDNQRIEMSQFIDFVREFEVGEVMTWEIIRDTDGDNSGGLRVGSPEVAGWADSPAALVLILRTLAVET